jgi:hypothetical protein
LSAAARAGRFNWSERLEGKNRRRGKNDNELKRELIFKEEGQEYAQVRVTAHNLHNRSAARLVHGGDSNARYSRCWATIAWRRTVLMGRRDSVISAARCGDASGSVKEILFFWDYESFRTTRPT